MRVKIEGAVTPERVYAVLTDVMQRVPGAATLHWLNLYFDLRDQAGHKLEAVDDVGSIATLVYRAQASTEEQRQVGSPRLKLIKA